jgi:uncharacterized protein YbaP (TraB family)
MPKTVRRKLFTGLLFLNIFIVSVYSVGQTPDTVSEKSCFWHVRTPTNSVYLLGSIHVLKKDMYPLRQVIEDAFETCSIAVFEINLDSSVTPAAQQMTLQKALFQDQRTLKNTLDEETYRLAEEKSKELGLSILQVNKFKPWFFTVTLMGLKLRQLGFDPVYGIDSYFFKKAKTAGMEIRSLETIEAQLDLFDTLADEEQKMLVRQTLTELEIFESELDSLVTAWESGDMATLETFVLQSYQDFPSIYQTFIVERNETWLPFIDRFLQETRNVFIIVGAGHILGKDGILEHITGKGIPVRQL